MMWDGDTFEFDIPVGFSGNLEILTADDDDLVNGDSLTQSIDDQSGCFWIDQHTGMLSFYNMYTTGTTAGFWAYVQDDSSDTNTDPPDQLQTDLHIGDLIAHERHFRGG